jgi:hypothetical protein
MTRMYSLNIRWMKSQINPERIEAFLSEAGDWLRFDAWSWLMYSSYSAHDIASALKEKLLPEDSIMIIACDPNDYSGFAQPWVWDWINKYRSPMPGLGGLGGKLSPRPLGLGMVPPNPAQTNPANALSKALASALTNPLSKKTLDNE